MSRREADLILPPVVPIARLKWLLLEARDNPTNWNLEQFQLAYLRIVAKIAQKHSYWCPYNYPDLFQVGCEELIKASHRLNRFQDEDHAINWIRRRVKHAIVNELSKISMIVKCTRSIQHRPKVYEIADVSHEEETILEIMDFARNEGETMILTMVAGGYTQGDICRQLGIKRAVIESLFERIRQQWK